MRAVLPPEDPRIAVPRIGDLPDPVPGPGEVLVAVEAAGLNHADLLQLRGHYPAPPGESDVPGLECAGRVLIPSPSPQPSPRAGEREIEGKILYFALLATGRPGMSAS